MPIPLPQPRHTVEKSDNLVRVTIPSKKNITRILFLCLWFFLWAYMLYGFVYITVAVNATVEAGKNSTPPVQQGNAFFLVIICLSLFLLALLTLGAFGIYRFIWLFTGQDIIEANSNLLKVTRQTFLGERAKEYSAGEVKGLRFVRQSRFLPFRSLKRLLEPNGMIEFDYGARTFRVGSELEEAEAKQIILAIQEGLPQQNAG